MPPHQDSGNSAALFPHKRTGHHSTLTLPLYPVNPGVGLAWLQLSLLAREVDWGLGEGFKMGKEGRQRG